ncbi:MAG: hypothetical protein V8R01_07080 [Bacilli bacterium]
MLGLFNVLEETVSNTTLCGGIEVPDTLFNLVATIIRIIKIVVPILLIIWGMLDFAKSVVAKKEEHKEISKVFCFKTNFCFISILNCYNCSASSKLSFWS